MFITARASLSVAVFLMAVGLSIAHQGESHPPKSWSFGQPGSSKDVTRTIQIQANEYSFNPEVNVVNQGETVRFVVKNTGKLMHELTIGDAAEQDAHRRSMSDTSDMPQHNGAHDMPANSVHIPPGQTRELIWTFSRGGKLIIACNYPGHSDLGMLGALEVQ